MTADAGGARSLAEPEAGAAHTCYDCQFFYKCPGKRCIEGWCEVWEAFHDMNHEACDRLSPEPEEDYY